MICAWQELLQILPVWLRGEVVDKSPGYAPVSVGIAVVQEVYWRNLAVHVAIGAYPYRHKGVNGPEAKAALKRKMCGASLAVQWLGL